MSEARASSRSWWLYAAAGAGAAGALCALRAAQRRGGAEAEETDFAGFLADPSTLPPAPAPGARRAAAAVDETGFDAFLRDLPSAADGDDPTGFDSFLRVVPSAGGGAAGGKQQQQKQQQQEEEVPQDRALVTVLFGTEYGFSREVAEKLAAELKAGGALWCARDRDRD